MKLLHYGVCANGYPQNGFEKALDEVFDTRHIHKSLPADKFIELCEAFKPDIIFVQVQQENVLTPSHLSYLRNQQCFKINWTGDVREPIPYWYYDAADSFTTTSFSNDTDVNEFRSKGFNSDYLQIGYDPEIYYPENHAIENGDIVFFGNNYKDHFPLSEYRAEMVDRLRKEFGCFKVYGHNWIEPDGNFNGSQDIEAAIYRGCKIAINLSHFNYLRYSSDRLLRILGSGSFCLSHNYKDIEKDYEIGKDLDVFNNLDELVEKCKYYLNADRSRIAINGFNKVYKRHTFKHMVYGIKELYYQYNDK